jgi:hypothetical protein
VSERIKIAIEPWPGDDGLRDVIARYGKWVVVESDGGRHTATHAASGLTVTNRTTTIEQASALAEWLSLDPAFADIDPQVKPAESDIDRMCARINEIAPYVAAPDDEDEDVCPHCGALESDWNA